MVASFPGAAAQGEHQRNFVAAAGPGSAALVDRGDAVLLAWDAQRSYTPVNRFKPPRLQRNALLRLAVPPKASSRQVTISDASLRRLISPWPTKRQSNAAVQTFSLTRIYGSMIALNSLNLTVNKGDLFGFIGSNGAGKTTTLRILATFLAPSGGAGRGARHDVVQEPMRSPCDRVHARFLSASTKTWK